MKSFLFFVAILSFTKISTQSDNNRVNEGASTSREESNCQQFEIENYATSVIRLMLAEDSSAASMEELVNDRTDELDAFYEGIFSNIRLVQHGTRDVNDDIFAVRRRAIFEPFLSQTVENMFHIACTEHYNHSLWYVYDRERDEIIVHENLRVLPSDQCLCGHFEEREILENSNYFPRVFYKHTAFQANRSELGMTAYRTTQYHIIPLSLINKFFRYWLSDKKDSLMHLNGCVRTLYYRLKRSMKKLLLAQLKKTNQINIEEMGRLVQIYFSENDTFSIEVLAYAESWLSGNIFLGPWNRGPINPRFSRYDEHSAEAFEYDARYIVDSRHFHNLQLLFHRLNQFISLSSYRNPLYRLLQGFYIFTRITDLLVIGSITPMNRDQWEERELREFELLRLRPEQREAARAHKFWDIKRPPNRFLRSVNSYETDLVTPNQDSKILSQKNIWTKFIKELMYISLETRATEESPIWLCNFTRLFDDYLVNNYFKKKEPITDDLHCPICIGFDEYLYSQILPKKVWKKCNDEAENFSDSWCWAWRNIMMDLKEDFNYTTEDEVEENFLIQPKSIEFIKNVEIFLHWLYSKLELKNKVVKNQLPYFKNGPYNNNKPDSDTTSSVLCFLSTITMDILFWKNDCHKTFG